MNCLNRSIPAFVKMAEDFGEIKTQFLLDSYFPNKIPTYDEFVSNKDIKKALGIMSKTQILEELGVSHKAQISQLALNLFKRTISRKNNDNFSKGVNIKYTLFNDRQVGESRNDNFTWGLRKIEKPLDMDAKIGRIQLKLVDAKQNQTPIAKLQELKDNKEQLDNLFGLSEESINEYKKSCK
jgi:hypothetical protein